MCDPNTQIMLLENIAKNTESGGYEYGGLTTVGGPTGSYQVHSPWNSEAEWAIYTIGAVAGSGLVCISGANNSLSNMTSANPTIGLSSGGMDNNAFQGSLFPVSATQSIVPFECWHPLGRGANVFVSINMSGSNVAYVVLAFRRLVRHVLPQIPRMKPHTHVPLSDRRRRTYLAASLEREGLAGKVINPQPDQDTATSRGHLAPGKNPMEMLDQLVKRRG